jgi:ATP-dependent DNA helicase RecG
LEKSLLHLVPSWHLNGTKLKDLSWPENQAHTKEAIEKVPSWSQSGTKLLQKKVGYFISILAITSAPASLD